MEGDQLNTRSRNPVILASTSIKMGIATTQHGCEEGIPTVEASVPTQAAVESACLQPSNTNILLHINLCYTAT